MILEAITLEQEPNLSTVTMGLELESQLNLYIGIRTIICFSF